MSTGSNNGESSALEEQAEYPRVESDSQFDSTRRTLRSLEDAAAELSLTMGLPAPRGQTQRDSLILAAHRALDAPDLTGINLKSPEWDTEQIELDQLLSAGTSLSNIRMEYERVLTPEAWTIEAEQIRDILVHSGTGPTRLLSGDYRHARSVLSEICLEPPPDELASQLVILNVIIDSQECVRIINANMTLGKTLFSPERISGYQSWIELESISNWRRALGKDIQTEVIPAGLIDYLVTDYSSSALRPMVQKLEELSKAHRVHAASVAAKLEAARRDLLDLGMRNPLLNYRLLRSRGARIQGHSAQDVLNALDEEEQTAVILPETEAKGRTRHRGFQLNTFHSTDELDRRLTSTYRLANSFILEQGVNTLFLALGMLKWVENGATTETRLAPLVLLPVTLERRTPRGTFLLKHTGEDPKTNVSLREKLRLDFDIELPELPDTEVQNIDEYFSTVSEAVVGLSGWAVDRRQIALGFFSFSKFLMYRDLDIETWPDDSSPAEHPIIEALLEDGFDEPAPTVTSDDNLDSFLAPGDSYQVVDADGSQSLALIDVTQGMNLVVQGPPGTGKSQTITNMIAEAVGNGRTVLFVSEKMAALEVVKRRLDNVGLGDACLELHSHKTAKKMVLDELARTLDLGRPRTGSLTEDVNELVRLRERLNGYCDAINLTVGQSGVTPFQAAGELLASSGISSPEMPIPDINQWSQAEYRRKRGLVEELQARVTAMGPPTEHPFWGTKLNELSPVNLDDLRTKLETFRAALQAMTGPIELLVQTMWLSEPTNLAESDQLTTAARLAADAPDLENFDSKHPHWTEHPDDVRSLVASGTAMAALKAEYGSSLKAQAWEEDLAADKAVLENQGAKLWRFLSPDFRKAKERLSRLLKPGEKTGVKKMLSMIVAVQSHQYNKFIFDGHESLGTELFGSRWKGVDSNWDQLNTATEWLLTLHRDVYAPSDLLNYLSSGSVSTQLADIATRVEDATADLRRAASDVSTALDLDIFSRFQQTGELADQSFDLQLQLPTDCLPRMQDIHDMVRLNAHGSVCQREGLQGVLEAAYQWSTGANVLRDSYDRAWFESIWDRALRERTQIRSFDGPAHEQIRENFQNLDRLILKHNRDKLSQAHWERMPRNQGGGQLAVLRRQFEMRRRHLPIRQLFERAGNPIQAIKPVFMMSPISIATYISPNSIKFDLVVFDEASQVKPVDALGAVMRSSQVVVVGDSQQLPPTPFFDTAGQVEETSEDELTSDIESILGLFTAQNAPTRMLRWHYRSHHDSLIAVSNQEFYGGGLVLFPSPDTSRQDTGLFYHHLPEAVYGRGTTSTNPLEAQAVARAVMEHARTKPELSLGVAAFSMAQTREVFDQLDALRDSDPSNEDFFASHPDEPFFVKNLETVQGDERDVILVSIGYGRADDGRIDLNFGPLNRQGGERRLNVLITRARRRCEVFTNMTEDDIDLNRTNSQGVRALRAFLAFANKGVLETAEYESNPEKHNEPINRFQKLLADNILNKGYMVAESPGWGTGTVDLAVSAPDHPGRYILGIECDGPSYASARSARDRDRLRPQVLDGLGWRLHRAWSPEWAINPEREMERVMAAIDAYEALVPVAIPELGLIEPPAPIIRDDVPKPEPSIKVAKYQIANLNFKASNKNLTKATPVSLLLWAARVVDTESPVHIAETAHRIFSAAGVTRPNKQLQNTMNEALDRLVVTGRVSRRGDFLWSNDMTQPPVRDRSGLPASTRKLDMISDDELEEAICFVVEQSYGIAKSQAPKAMFTLLGYGRTNQAMKDRFSEVVESLISAGLLGDDGENLVLASPSRNDPVHSSAN